MTTTKTSFKLLALALLVIVGCIDSDDASHDDLRFASASLYVSQGRDGIDVTNAAGELLQGDIEVECPYSIFTSDGLIPTVDGTEFNSSSCQEGQLDVLSDTAIVCACVDENGVGSTQSCNYGPCSACCAGSVPGGHTPNKKIWVTRPNSCDVIPC